jgi:hypothetical protein
MDAAIVRLRFIMAISTAGGSPAQLLLEMGISEMGTSLHTTH